MLIPIADTGEFPVNLAAIKMMTKVVEKLTKEEAEECLHEVIPKLVKVSWTFLYICLFLFVIVCFSLLVSVSLSLSQTFSFSNSFSFSLDWLDWVVVRTIEDWQLSFNSRSVVD